MTLTTAVPLSSALNRFASIRQVIVIAKRFCLYLTLAIASLAALVGCQPDKSATTATQAEAPEAGALPLTETRTPGASALPLTETSVLAEVRAAYERKAYDEAATAVYQLLIQRPDDPDVLLLAARIEAARSKPDLAVALASSIDLKSPLGKAAAELRYRQSLLARDGRQAELALQDLVSLEPDNASWQHERWQLFNLQGRRQDASELAEQFCRHGTATDSELLSLIRRTDSYPSFMPRDRMPEEVFFAGLGVARWYFTQKDYARAIEELERAELSSTLNPEAIALWGRLLAETQGVEKIPAWNARCTDEVKQFGDYWAALGTIFVDRGEYQAAARALLEAIYRNPTDRVCYQRMGRVLEALNNPDDAAQFRYQGICIADTERGAEQLIEAPSRLGIKSTMAKKMMELQRPFETLGWTLSTLPATSSRERTIIGQQLDQLRQNPVALTMASEAALFGLNRADFTLGDALQRITGNADPVAAKFSATVDATTLAIPRLVNVAEAVGLDFQWYPDEQAEITSIPIYKSVGGGIAVIDYDLDGWPDVYLAQGSGKPPLQVGKMSNVLYRNQGGRFKNATKMSQCEDFNYSSGQAIGDVNQDGFPDLYIGNLGRNRLLINNGDGTFADVSERITAHVDTFTTSVAIADINGDALPDIFEGNYIEMEGAFALPEVGPDGQEQQPSPLKHYAQSDRWFRNLGNGKFDAQFIDEKIAKPGTSLGVVVTDFNHDGLNEVFVGNDVRANHYLIQDQQGGFRNAADALGCANGFNGAPTGCMGIATGDFDRDGRIDLQIANFYDESANLFLQTPSQTFVDAAIRYQFNRLTLPYVGFGTKSFDADRNGWIDFAVTNGHIFDTTAEGEPFQMPPQFLVAKGDHYEQVNVEDPSGYWGRQYLGRAMSTIDFDRNGTIDLLIGHLDAKLALLSNETQTAGRYVQFEFIGTSSERDAIGARIVVEAAGQSFSQWVTAGDGYFSNDEPVIEIGLGTVQSIDAVHVHWPSGKQQSFDDVKLDSRYLVVENEAELTVR